MRKKILWLIQANQITPTIAAFLKTFQTRLEHHIDLCFIVPDSSSEILERIKGLNPRSFKTTTRAATNSQPAYRAKCSALETGTFADGLSVSDTLLLDDLGAGTVQETLIDLPVPENTCGLILQIPTPLGSSDMEEKIFHAMILWARQHRVPAAGYELLPLDTRWTLAPSLPDGVITRYPESRDLLKAELGHGNVWLLPRYEASIFSSVSDQFNLNGAKAAYHYRNTHSIPANRTVIYLPHNVAMTHEYQALIKALAPLGKKLHIMLGIGKDQTRGAYSQEQAITLIYEKELKAFASHSFHDMSVPWEMMMAEAVVACSACFNTQIAEKELPCIIYDTRLAPMARGNKTRINTKEGLLEIMEDMIRQQQGKTELADVLMSMILGGKPK